MSILFNRRVLFTRALKSRPYTFLWTGQAISNLGNSIFSISLAWQVLLMTHSGTAIGLVLLVTSISQLLFVLLGGVVADRFPRRMIILCSDGGRGLVVLLITILGLTGHLQFWHLLVEACIFGCVSGFFNPAVMSIIPDLVAREDLASANALNALSNNIARILGPILAALLITLTTPMGAFAVNALSFFLAFVFLLFAHIPARQTTSQIAQKEDDQSQRTGLRSIVADIGEGIGEVRASRWLWVSILASSIGNIGSNASLFVALPLLVNKVYAQGAWLLSLITIAGAMGSMLALFLIGQLAKRKRRGLLAHFASILASLGFVLLGSPFPQALAPVLASLAGLMIGFGLAFYNTIWYTIIQEMVPSEKLGRVLSIDTLGSMAMTPFAQGVGGVVVDSIGPAMVCILGGSLGLITAIAPLFVREIQEMQ